jgi:hypothetical protein
MTIERLEEMARAGGHELKFQDLDELATLVVDGIRDERFVIMKDIDTIGPTLRRRAEAFEKGELPAHAGGLLG